MRSLMEPLGVELEFERLMNEFREESLERYAKTFNEPALAALKEAITRNPDYAEAHYLLAFVYGDLGQHEAARDDRESSDMP